MNNYWRSVGLVLAGTGAAQVIPVIGTLVVARIYSPADFGVFSAWLGVAMLISVMLTGRFETALAIEPDGESRRLAVLAILATTLLVASLSVVVLVALSITLQSLDLNISSILIVSLVPTALIIAWSIILQSWAAAEGRYRTLSWMRIGHAGAVTVVQIFAGLTYPTASALGLGYLLGGALGLILSIVLLPVGRFPGGTIRKTVSSFWRRHSGCPKYGMPAGLISTAAAQLPVLIIANRFGAEIAGMLALTLRMLGAPIALLGKSVLDVFKRHAATSFRERGECRLDYLRTLKVLALGSFVFSFAMFFSSEWLFEIAFGEEWRKAGTIAVWLLPLFTLRFIASPLSYMVFIAGKQHVDLCWQLSLLFTTVFTLGFSNNYNVALLTYSLVSSLLYCFYLWMSYQFSCGNHP